MEGYIDHSNKEHQRENEQRAPIRMMMATKRHDRTLRRAFNTRGTASVPLAFGCAGGLCLRFNAKKPFGDLVV
ncbi:unnamed protein product [Gadus morhua 'NCC']